MQEFEELTQKNQEIVHINHVKNDIDEMIEHLNRLFIDGLVTDKRVFDLYSAVKYMSNRVEELSKSSEVRNVITAELQKFGGKYEGENYTVSMRKYGKYDYSNTGHPAIDLADYITETMQDFVKNAKDIAKKQAEASNLKNNVVALLKEDVETLKGNIDMAFDNLLDLFGDQELINIKVKPAAFKGEEIPVLTPKKLNK